MTDLREVTALITCEGRDLGSIGPFPVESPWWSDVEPVVDHCRAMLGVNVAVTRLVDVTGGRSPRDGHVVYHVEALRRPAVVLPSATFAGVHQPARHRASWATPHGVRDALAWASGHLATDAPILDIAEQVKTWNLSALFRVPVPGADPVWLKLTPPFAAHEPSVTELVASVDAGLVPEILATDATHRRALLKHVPGQDSWDAGAELIRTVVERWVGAQAALAAGPPPDPAVIPHRLPRDLPDGLATLLDGETGAMLDPDERTAARTLLARLPGLIDALDDCGLPATLVHGDFHPGNWRTAPRSTVLIDFADAYWGHPAFDCERLREFVGPDRGPAVADAWSRAWRQARPGSRPERALRLTRPLQAISGAIGYQRFLDHIEDSERRYHELDPPQGVRDAIAALRDLDRQSD